MVVCVNEHEHWTCICISCVWHWTHSMLQYVVSWLHFTVLHTEIVITHSILYVYILTYYFDRNLWTHSTHSLTGQNKSIERGLIYNDSWLSPWSIHLSLKMQSHIVWECVCVSVSVDLFLRISIRTQCIEMRPTIWVPMCVYLRKLCLFILMQY